MAAVLMPVFLDNLGYGIVIPVIAPIFLDVRGGVLPFSWSFGARTLALGLLIATYPAAAFFGAPILGSLSDKWGRRKLLLVALLGTAVGYGVFGVGVLTGSLGLLFTGRLLDGFTGGNVSIIYSALSDLSSKKDRARNFGLVGAALGLGFILGPYIGGRLTAPHVTRWLQSPLQNWSVVSLWMGRIRDGVDGVGGWGMRGGLGELGGRLADVVEMHPANTAFALPFWVAGAVGLLNVLLVWWRFPETLKKVTGGKMRWWQGISDIKKVCGKANLRVVFGAVFLLAFGFNFFVQFFPVFLVEKFGFGAVEIGDLFAYVGLWVAFSQIVLIGPLSAKWGTEGMLRKAVVLLGLTLPVLLLPRNPGELFLIVPMVAVLEGLIQTAYTAVVSEMAGDRSQGEILGINQSVQYLTQIIPPVVAGVAVSVHLSLAIWVVVGSTFLAFLVLTQIGKRNGRISDA